MRVSADCAGLPAAVSTGSHHAAAAGGLIPSEEAEE